MSDLKQGMMSPGEAPAHWGFTEANFAGDSYLWITGKRCTISFIESKKKGKGNFSKLVKAIEKDGFTVEVPTPLGLMQAILTRWGFKHDLEWAEDFQEPVDIWKR